MNTVSQRDQLFHTAQNLTFDDLRKFCQLDRAHRILCSEPRFQQLIQQRYQETTQGKVRNILDKINNTQGPISITYELVPFVQTPTERMHMLDLYKNDEQEIEFLEETIVGIPLENSLLYQLFKKKTGFRGIENLSRREFNNLARQLDPNEYDINSILNRPYGKYFLLNALMIEEFNKLEPSSRFSEQRFEYEVLDNINDGRLRLGYPTNEDLRAVVLQLVENYPNHTVQLQNHM